MSDKAVYRTAPATPGLLIMILSRKEEQLSEEFLFLISDAGDLEFTYKQKNNLYHPT